MPVMTYSQPAVRNAWADTAVPTTDIVDPGNAIVTEGWLQSATPPPRQYFNWVLNWSAAAIRFFMQQGISTWASTETYSINSIVQQGGVLYQSAINSNTGNTPSSFTGTSWKALNDYVYSPTGATGGANNIANYVLTSVLTSTLASYVTQTSLTSQLSNYVTNASLATTLNNYLTITDAINNYVSNTSLASQLTGYLSKSLASTTYATLISPAFSGTPTAPTAAAGTNNTQIATTQFAAGTFLKSTAGYVKLPSGIIIQWGLTGPSSGGGSSQSVTFPIAFTVNCYSITATASVIQATIWISDPYSSNTGFTVTNGAVNSLSSWIAIGV